MYLLKICHARVLRPFIFYSLFAFIIQTRMVKLLHLHTDDRVFLSKSGDAVSYCTRRAPNLFQQHKQIKFCSALLSPIF